MFIRGDSMNPESERLHEEIMEWHKDFLQYYIKKEDAPIEFINRGIDMLERYRETSLEADEDEFWDFAPGSPFREYAERLYHRMREHQGHRLNP